jgi:RNA polymerase sigma-70 factor (ECF subfamily)
MCSEWVQKHSGELYGFAFRWCGQAHSAEDLVAETFSEAWKSIEKLDDQSKSRAWLFRILRRRCANMVRDNKKKLSALPLENQDVEDPKDRFNQYELQESLQKAISRLDEKHRLPFLCVTVEGLSCREAASQLGLPLGTLLNRVHRAKKQLQIELKDLDESPQHHIHSFNEGAG